MNFKLHQQPYFVRQMVREFEREKGEKMKNDGMNPGAVVKHQGKVMIFLFGENVKKCLGINEHGRLEVMRIEGEVELIKYAHLTNFLRTRLNFLNEKYGDKENGNERG